MLLTTAWESRIRNRNRVFAVWQVTISSQGNRQHKCLGRYRSAYTVGELLRQSPGRCYATIDGVIVAKNWAPPTVQIPWGDDITTDIDRMVAY